jgi:hypothetical protein
MSIEFIGSLVNASAANSFARSGGSDADYPARMARLHEDSGFDRLRPNSVLPFLPRLALRKLCADTAGT